MAANEHGSRDGDPTKVSPAVRCAIQHTLSESEYIWFRRRILSQLPPYIHGKLPSSSTYASSLTNVDDFNAATVRVSTRLFLAVQAALKLYQFILAQISRRRAQQQRVVVAKGPFWKSANFRLSLSASLLLFFHRLLHRFFSRLRLNLLTKDAAPFRKRNPRVSRVLTSSLAPAVGASFAGYALAVAPNDGTRVVIAIYTATKAGEFAFNALDADGWFEGRPWWFGSWMLMPFTFGQLLHSFVFDRDCFPQAYGKFIMNFTPNYVQQRPAHLPQSLPWPSQDDIVDGLATMSRLRYPLFVSPILFPDVKSTLPSALESISPITSSAHPAIRNMSCALLHPSEPSCLRTNVEYYVKTIPRLTRFFAVVYAVFAVPRYRKIMADPSRELNRWSKSVLLSTTSIAASIGTSWGSICLFQNLFPQNFLPTKRWFLGGFLAGLWAFLEREHGRPHFLYGLRISLESLWKLGVKKGYWRPGKTGDVWIIIGSLMLLNVVHGHNTDAVSSGIFRRGLNLARGEPMGKSSRDNKQSESSATEKGS